MTFSGIRTHQIIAEHYRVERELGRGGSAVVYRAYDQRHERRVAIKVLHPELASALGAQRFLREIKTMAALQHPHIVPIFDSGETDGMLFYVMPYVEADSLRRRLTTEPNLPIGDAVRIAREIAGALAFAHQNGILHRDIKPENILFLGGHACLTDFGIARPMRASAERLTAHDIIVGTPEYMSPEQGKNSELDGRSDVYSLACVLYEMLAGVPPFSGDTPVDALRVRFSRTPPPVRTWRADVPPEIEEVLSRALATSPDERYDTAQAFGDALTRAISGPHAMPQRKRFTRSVAVRAVRSPRTWAGVLAAAFVAVLVLRPGVREQLLGAALGPLDSTRYVVIPFDGAAPGATGQAVASSVRAALEGWSGLHVVTDLSVENAAHGKTGSWTLDRALATARSLGAGRVLLGRVVPDSGRTRIEAVVYDTRTGASRREATAEFSVAQAGEAATAAGELATELVSEGAMPRRALAARGATRSIAAWSAYRAGHVALEQWNLAAAESDFVRATSADGSFAAAHAWLAQVALWRRDLAQVDWHRHAMATTVNEWPSVASDDALRASALRSLATGDAPAACRAYNTLTARDSLDATAWLGLGDCQALDSLVVRDAKSPSGWQFRGDYDAAMRAYEHAVRANGGAYAALPFSYVRFIVNVRPNALRRGRDASGRLFLGLAAFDAGHPYYVPYAARGNGGAAGSDIAPTMLAFSRFNADRLLAFSRDWVAQVPASPDAYEALATVLEERGQLTDREDGMGISAMAALDSAMRRTHDDTRIARLTSSRVRLLVKHEEFAKASALVDSILSVDRTPTPATADWLVGLASLTGRAAKAGELDRIAMAAATDDAGIPAPLTERITRTTVESALGVCGATMQSELDALDAAIDSYVEPARRDAVRARGVFRAWSNAVPCFGPSIVAKVPPQPDRLLTMQQALGRGQVSVVRAQLDTLARYRANARAADVSMDYSFNEAWLRHRIGDDAIATRSLDLVLGALPSISQWAVTEPVQAAAVGRTMLFRAELADAAHDRATARRWAAATLALWSHADPTLGPALARARALAK